MHTFKSKIHGDMKKMNSLADLKDCFEEAVSKKAVEPFNADYLSGKPYEYELPAWERRFVRKVSILENKLKRKGIRYGWDRRERCFTVWKYRFGSAYPTYRYVRVNVRENDYSFGTDTEDLVFDGRVSAVVDAAAKWLGA